MDKSNYSFTTYYIGANDDISYTVTTLDEDRRDRRMTKAEILKQIEELRETNRRVEKNAEELRKQVEKLPNDEKKIRITPTFKDHYFAIDGEGVKPHKMVYPAFYGEYIASIGNYFKSKKDAEMVVRAMQIEQSIRIRRIELNNGWEPDWYDAVERKYYVYFTSDGYLTVYKSFLNKFLPIFGYYKTEEIARQIINEFEDDLLWYFNEYYPNKDMMYVWE